MKKFTICCAYNELFELDGLCVNLILDKKVNTGAEIVQQEMKRDC